VLDAVQDITGQKAKVKYTEPLKGDILRMRYDYSKAKARFGFEPKYSMHDGVKRLVEYSKSK
jgi:nucleoside-diphosphate-sugar epimerase